MTSTFARARGGRIKVRLGDADRGVVAGLLEAVADLLDPEVDASADPAPAPDAADAGSHAPDEAALWASLEADLAVEPPADPAVARLLPDASRDDPELAQSFRRLTEQDLRERKRDSLGLAAGAMRRRAPVMRNAWASPPTRTPSSCTRRWPRGPARAGRSGPRRRSCTRS
jgi:Domain of unknown function (DUF2017)